MSMGYGVVSRGDDSAEVGLNSARDNLHERNSSEFGKLFAAARVGSREQQAELLNSFRNYLRALATMAIGPEAKGKLSVSDLVQSAIIDACEGFENCRASGKDEFKAWLRQILMNDIKNRYRYLRRQKRDISKEVCMDAESVAAPDNHSPVAEAQRKEDELRLIAAISQLKVEHQEVIRLRHRDKMPFAEIGAKMNRSADAVRMLWNRAVDELAKALEQSELVDEQD